MGMFYLFCFCGLVTGAVCPWLVAAYFWENRPSWYDDLGFGAWLREEPAIRLCCAASTIACLIPLIVH